MEGLLGWNRALLQCSFAKPGRIFLALCSPSPLLAAPPAAAAALPRSAAKTVDALLLALAVSPTDPTALSQTNSSKTLCDQPPTFQIAATFVSSVLRLRSAVSGPHI
eukprot:1119606-Rhodomonas_salina.4